jgi:hypothetical protein
MVMHSHSSLMKRAPDHSLAVHNASPGPPVLYASPCAVEATAGALMRSLSTDLIQVFLGRPGGRRQSAGGFNMAADTVERTSKESLTSRCGQTAGDDGWPLAYFTDRLPLCEVVDRGVWHAILQRITRIRRRHHLSNASSLAKSHFVDAQVSAPCSNTGMTRLLYSLSYVARLILEGQTLTSSVCMTSLTISICLRISRADIHQLSSVLPR